MGYFLTSASMNPPVTPKAICPLRQVQQSGLRFYKPDVGRWVNRDPMEEEGGVNLYSLVNNEPVRRSDVLGLASVDFEVIKGPAFAGGLLLEWGQPASSAMGAYSITDTEAWSMVRIENRVGGWPNGACNSTWGRNAGQINVFLRTVCPGRFRVELSGSVVLWGTGPHGKADANYYSVNADGSHGRSHGPWVGTSSETYGGTISDTVTVSLGFLETKLIGQYIPTIRFIMNTPEHSTGFAYGSIRALSVTTL